MTRPDLTLIEFEQIYDEYIQLCGNKPECLGSELVYTHLVKNSIFLNRAEKQAILSESLESFNSAQRAERNVFDMARPDGEEYGEEDSKQQNE